VGRDPGTCASTGLFEKAGSGLFVVLALGFFGFWFPVFSCLMPGVNDEESVDAKFQCKWPDKLAE
jgi:hypothetical protein